METEVAGRSQGGGRDRVERLPPLRDGDLDEPAQVARRQPVGHDVVGDQQHATAIGQRHDRRDHVGRERLLLQHHPQTLAQLLAQLRGRRQGVVGPDAARDVARQLGPGEGRHVAFETETRVGRRAHHGEQMRVAVDQALEVHEFTQGHHARLPRQFGHVLGADRRVGRLHVRGRRGDAARDRREDPLRQPLAGPHHPADAGRAGHVGDLVRVLQDRGGAVGQRRLREASRRDEARLDVHVHVEQPRLHGGAAHVDPLASRQRLGRGRFARLDLDETTVLHREPPAVRGLGDDVDELGAVDEQVAHQAAAACRSSTARMAISIVVASTCR